MVDENHGGVSLRGYLDLKIADLEKYFTEMIISRDKALLVALATMEKRLDGMNHLKAQLDDREKTYIPRLQYEVEHKVLSDRVDELRLSRALLEGKASQFSVNIAMFISFVSMMIGVISIILKFVK